MEITRTASTQPLQHETASQERPVTASKEKETTHLQQAWHDPMPVEEIDNLVSELNDLMKPHRTNLKFELHDKLNEYFVKVVDQDTNEVIREIPPEKMLDKHAAMAEFMGLLVDETI